MRNILREFEVGVFVLQRGNSREVHAGWGCSAPNAGADPAAAPKEKAIVGRWFGFQA